MKKTITIIVVALAVFLSTGASVAAAVAVDSLRGGQDITETSKKPAKRKQLLVEGGIERSYKLQPPAIPHKTEKDEINLKVNTCMNCHSEKTYVQKKAPKAGDSHYVARDGTVQETLASRRYFCDQCHATQVNADPLVENNFQGAQ